MKSRLVSEMRLYSASGERLYLNATEREAFRHAAHNQPPVIKAFCLFLLHVGCRLSEARFLRVRNIQESEGVVAIRTLKQRKNGKVRELPIHREAVTALLDLGLSPAARPWPVSRTTAWRWIKRVMDEAGLSGINASPKGLRHGFGVACVIGGVPIVTISNWLGHARLETTMIYTTVCGPEAKRLAERMWSQADPVELSA